MQAIIGRRPLLAAVGGIIAVQLAFTATLRLYVVPRLLPASHWQFGLQSLSDSSLFHEKAAILADGARRGDQIHKFGIQERLLHVEAIALVYYLAGLDDPRLVYALNACLAGLTVALVGSIGLVCGLSRGRAAALAALLGASPLSMFVHSELLREPFILPALQLTWLGCLLLIHPRQVLLARSAPVVALAGAVSLAAGYVLASSLRPYLLMPLVGALGLVLVLGTAWRWLAKSPWRVWATGHLAFATTLVLVVVGFVGPTRGKIQQYSERGAAAEEEPARKAPRPTPLRPPLASRPAAAAPTPALPVDRPLTPADLRISHTCGVRWQKSGVLPESIDGPLEALSCVREDYLRYCDPAVMGERIDRHCDQRRFSSVGDMLAGVPRAAVFALFVPFPKMWFDGFGSGGTGLRRAGYVIDGLTAYAILPGLIGLFIRRRGGPAAAPLVCVTVGLLVMMVLYGLAVPTQFILARMRHGFYLPLLVMAVVGWQRLATGRESARSSGAFVATGRSA
jgi:hypothetical protein